MDLPGTMNRRIRRAASAALTILALVSLLACEPGQDSQQATAAYQRAAALANSGRLEEAARELDASLALDPTLASTHVLRGAIYERMQELDAAERSYREALRLEPDQPTAPLHLARLGRLRALDARIVAARAELDAAEDPGSAHLALAELLLERRLATPAQHQFDAALRNDPDSAAAHSGLAVVLIGLHRQVRGLYHASEALRLEPGEPRALEELVWVLATSSEESLRDPAEAIRRAEQSPDPTTRLLDGLAAAYAAAGQQELAVATARSAIEHAVANQDHGSAHAIRERLSRYERGDSYTGPPVDPS